MANKRNDRRNKRIRPTKPQAEKPVIHRPISEPVGVSFRYVTPGDRFCLSQCTRDQVRGYKECLRRLTTLPWSEVLRSGTKGKGKRGLNFTPYPDTALRKVTRPITLSKELQISGVRAGSGVRMFGAYENGVYYLLWFDRNHDIVKG